MDERIHDLVLSRPIPQKLAERLAREMVEPTMLSSREKDVLALIANGYTAREIADLMHLSHWTIGSHQARIRMKLGARNMAHAVAIGLLAGHIERDLIEFG